MEEGIRKTELEKEERIDDIGFGGLKLVQRPGEFCYGVDAVLLADAASKTADVRSIADLGTGTGVIPLILSHKTDADIIVGVEIQKNSFLSAEKSVEASGLQGRVIMVQADVSEPDELKKKIREKTAGYGAADSKGTGKTSENVATGSESAGKTAKELADGGFDLVTANPPYTKASSGITGSAEPKSIARHEVACSLEDFFISAAMLLKSRGHFFMVHRPARLVDIFSLGRKYRLEPKTIRLIRPDEDSAPSMVLVDMIKGGGKQLDIKGDLYIRDRSGEYSREITEIYERENYQNYQK